MNNRLLAILAVATAPLLMTACGKSEAPSASAGGQAAAPVLATMPDTDVAGELVINGFVSPVPAAWMATQPSSSMRVAQYALPPAEGAEAGELAVFYFPTGQGGSHEANIDRWSSQFTAEDGKPVAPNITVEKVGDNEMTLVELQGRYARGVGMGPGDEAKPDQVLLVALVETPIGRITLQMYGPAKTVGIHRDRFVKFAKNFKQA